MKKIAALLTISLIAIACGDDGTTGAETTQSGAVLTEAEAEWCSFPDNTDESAHRFDQIFETGLGLGLAMDALNASASVRRTEYLESGMTEDEAIRAVSLDLLEDGTFREACKQAYVDFNAG